MERDQPLPRLYAIADAATIQQRRPFAPFAVSNFVSELVAAGAKFLQYRDKKSGSRGVVSAARNIRRLAARAALIMNDRADLCLAAGFDGVHVGADDLSPEGARMVVGAKLLVGISTHNLRQVKAAHQSASDYIAIGPVFATHSKDRPEPITGLDLVKQARRLTRKPLVAIGGITRANCPDVINAGADSVAVISDLLDSPGKRVEEFLRLLE